MGGLTFKPGDVVTWRTSAGRTFTAPVLDAYPQDSDDYAQVYGVLVGFTLDGDGDVDPEEGVVLRSDWERLGLRHATAQERGHLMEAMWVKLHTLSRGRW